MNHITLNQMSPTISQTLEPFVCGGSAAIAASCVIHPIDLAKVRMQIFGQLHPGEPIPNFPTIISRIVASEGIPSIYKGLDAAIGRQAVYGTARIGLHRSFSTALEERNGGQPLSFFMKAISGMASGATAVCIGTPFDIALVRLQSDSMSPEKEVSERSERALMKTRILAMIPQNGYRRLHPRLHSTVTSTTKLIHSQRRNYKNVFDALIRTSKEEGFGALYKGLAPNILRGMSMNVGMMACYDQAKEGYSKVLSDDPKHPGLPVKILSSATAGFTAAAFSLPFDLIKSRLMAMQPDASGKLPYSGVANCAATILRVEGIRGFWAGFTAYYGRCAPHAMIILLSIDTITSNYRRVTD